MLTPSTSDPTSSRLLVLAGSYPETRIGAFDFYAATCTEPLWCGSADGQRAYGASWSEVAEDLFLFSQEDPLARGARSAPRWLYGYADNRPNVALDPTGLYTIDPSCQCQTGPPNAFACSQNPTANCIVPIMGEIEKRLGTSPCQRAFSMFGFDIGKFRQAITFGAHSPRFTCDQSDCSNRGGGSGGKYYLGSDSIPICKRSYTAGFQPQAQTMFHELLHSIGAVHDFNMKYTVRACFRDFFPPGAGLHPGLDVQEGDF